MIIPIGTKFITYKEAQVGTGYQVKKLLSNGEYWCQNLSAHHQKDPLAGTTFPNNFLESIVDKPWQPPGFGIKRKSQSPKSPKSPASRRKSSRRKSSRKKNN
jgi:hypothetical protein